MSLSSRFKTTFVLWPRRLLDQKEDGPDGTWKKVGWVWLQRAHLVNNASLGWIAFIDYQTSKYLDHCHVCGKPLEAAHSITTESKKGKP